MKRSPSSPIEEKRSQLVQRTAAALGVSEHEAAAFLCMPRTQSVRINLLKAPATYLLSAERRLAGNGLRLAYAWVYH